MYALDAWHRPRDDSAIHHGSCVASKAVGLHAGVAKKSKLIMMKIDWESGRDIVYAFDRVYSDIKAKHREARSVVVFAGTTKESEDPSMIVADTQLNSIKSCMFDLMNELATVVVVPSGNMAERPGPRREFVDTVPGLWATPQFPLIVVGAVNHLQGKAWFSQMGPQVTVWAPGEDIICWHGDISARYVYDSGTSFATGTVSDSSAIEAYYRHCTNLVNQVGGLMAYLLDQFPERPRPSPSLTRVMHARDKLVSLAWRRNPSGLLIIWNGEDGSKVGPPAKNISVS